MSRKLILHVLEPEAASRMILELRAGEVLKDHCATW